MHASVCLHSCLVVLKLLPVAQQLCLPARPFAVRGAIRGMLRLYMQHLLWHPCLLLLLLLCCCCCCCCCCCLLHV